MLNSAIKGYSTEIVFPFIRELFSIVYFAFMNPKKVCVIGAGPSGITAAKNLLDEGLTVVVYDLGEEVGGNWVFTDKVGHSSVFETTHIISSRTLSQYDDFPMPEN